MPIGLAGLSALGLDRQLAVSHRDLDVLDRVDARKLGTNFVESVLHRVFNPQQVAIEERPQASEAGDGRKAMKATEELGKLREQWARLTLNSKLIHDSSWVGSSVHHARRNQNRRIRWGACGRTAGQHEAKVGVCAGSFRASTP